MKLFGCQSCHQVVFFENTVCVRCSHRLDYIPSAATITALDPEGEGLWRALHNSERYRFCANEEFGVCNWLVEEVSQEQFCLACRHNRIVPNVHVDSNLEAWAKIEAAKHRLFYSLIRLRLPLSNRLDAPDYGLTFLFQAQLSRGPKIMTGHDNRLITIALEEADDAERESRRVAMHEPYRTLLGHFRHEVGHYYWDRLVRDDNKKLEAARSIFGDDRADYEESLKAYYANGAPPDWQKRCVTAYATAHPWEDFAETWAHYLHIVDTLEMVGAYGMHVDPKIDGADRFEVAVDFDPYRAPDVKQLLSTWLPLSVALNSVNRAMGQPDLYPFVLSPQTATKFGFIHSLMQCD